MTLKGIGYAVLAGVIAFAGLGSIQNAIASDFPSKPIVLVAPFGPGGPSDILARFIAEQVHIKTGHRMVVMNKPGASATLGTAEVYRATPDGYTLLLADTISSLLQPLRMKLSYSGPQDIEPIVKLVSSLNTLAVRQDAKWRTLQEFINDAKANPESLRVANAGLFTGTDLAVRELHQMAGIRTTLVPSSSGSGATIALLLGGHVDAIAVAPSAVVSSVNAGKIRVLASFTSQRIPSLPDTPSTWELGYKNQMIPFNFISGPKGIEKEVVKKLEEIFRKVIVSQEFSEFVTKAGYKPEFLDREPLAKELEEWHQRFAAFLKQIDVREKQ